VDVADVVVRPGLHRSLERLGLVWATSPVSNRPFIAVKVCVAESLLVTLIVAPGDTVNAIGKNMKFEMVIWVPLCGAPVD
jgi:hypothetical protein